MGVYSQKCLIKGITRCYGMDFNLFTEIKETFSDVYNLTILLLFT